jgi:hypothetical protein
MDEIAAVEVYSEVDLPVQFTSSGRQPCGAVVVWTKMRFR